MKVEQSHISTFFTFSVCCLYLSKIFKTNPTALWYICQVYCLAYKSDNNTSNNIKDLKFRTMRKNLFSMMLCLGAMGGATVVAPVNATAAVAQAPTIKVQGQVVDETGAPLMGASVKAKNSKAGTVTDMDGKFVLDVDANATLLVSYLGYKTSEVAVRGRAIIEKIELTPDNNMLE